VKSALLLFLILAVSAFAAERARPNILFCIADDASYAHFGANGDPAIRTPVFDRVCRDGVRFTGSHCSSPSCTPSRGAILTGRPFLQLEEGGNLWSTLQKAKFAVYPDLLEAAGYTIGLQGKGWGPGDFKPGGFTRNPSGPGFKSFAQFRKTAPAGKPWCFWFGSTDPHRPYDRGSGSKAGIDPAKVRVPPYLPDEPITREDLADYMAEIERFDHDTGEIIAQVEAAGELENTLIIVTSDNGLPFPRAKANLYDSGTHMPLAIMWKEHIAPGRQIDDFVSHTDFAPTFLEAAGVPVPKEIIGRSLLPLLTSGRSGQVESGRDKVFVGRERHANVRSGRVGYPARAIRTADFLYIVNLAPDRWPAGDPEELPESPQGIYGDIDEGPTKAWMIDNRDSSKVATPWPLAFEKRPAEELYDLRKDPNEMRNVAQRPEYAGALKEMSSELESWRKEMKDPSLDGNPSHFDGFPYYGKKGR